MILFLPQVSMQDPVRPFQMICVKFQCEGGLGEVADRHVEVVQLVNVTEEHFVTVLF